MPDAAARVRDAIARRTGRSPDTIETRAETGEHGTLVFAARTAEAVPELSERDRWFAAFAIYVDGGTGRLFRLPNNVAFLPKAEEFLADSANRARTELKDVT
jgi:hypothetical protein